MVTINIIIYKLMFFVNTFQFKCELESSYTCYCFDIQVPNMQQCFVVYLRHKTKIKYNC